jgi:NADH dehydrogenase
VQLRLCRLQPNFSRETEGSVSEVVHHSLSTCHKKANRIVIVGGGIAGILLATRLSDRLSRSGEATVTLIDKSPTHIWKPMLHTIAAATRDVNQQRVIYLSHARQHGFSYQPGEMCGLDRQRREVQLAAVSALEGGLMLKPRTVPYDVLCCA